MAKYWLHGVCVCVCSDHKQLLPLSLSRVQSERLVTMEDLGVCLE